MSQPISPTHERIVRAAMSIFARDGLQGATTRAIAMEAGVNEVTLFRHFQNKEGLLAAVMIHAVQANHEADTGEEALWKGDLKDNLRRFADRLYANLVREEAFLRTMIGEARRHPEHSKKLIMDAIKPVRDRFIANLEAAREANLVRCGIDLGISADAFTAMLLAGMLRNTAGCHWDYKPEDYVATCVDLFAAALAPLNGK